MCIYIYTVYRITQQKRRSKHPNCCRLLTLDTFVATRTRLLVLPNECITDRSRMSTVRTLISASSEAAPSFLACLQLCRKQVQSLQLVPSLGKTHHKQPALHKYNKTAADAATPPTRTNFLLHSMPACSSQTIYLPNTSPQPPKASTWGRGSGAALRCTAHKRTCLHEPTK